MSNFRAFFRMMTLTVGAIVATALVVAQSHAVEKCKVKVDSKTGAIQVSASNVTGTLRWGDADGKENKSFANDTTCLATAKAKNCELGGPGSDAQITPPERCRLFLADISATKCNIFIKGCVPGLRLDSLVTGPKGDKGDQGPIGTTGPAGSPGADGPAGPNVIPSGETRSGYYSAAGVGGVGAGNSIFAEYYFPLKAPSTPTLEFVSLNGPFTANCPFKGRAAAGILCIYEMIDTGQKARFFPTNFIDTKAGFRVQSDGAVAGTYHEEAGIWAYTAP